METTTRPVGPFARPRSGPAVPRAPESPQSPEVLGRSDRLDGWRDLLREHFVALDVRA